jgi:PAS domain S-box-containing protein
MSSHQHKIPHPENIWNRTTTETREIKSQPNHIQALFKKQVHTIIQQVKRVLTKNSPNMKELQELENKVQTISDIQWIVRIIIDFIITKRMNRQLTKVNKKLMEENRLLREESNILNMLDSIIKTDASGIILEANGEFIRASGYTREELVGRKIWFHSSWIHTQEFWNTFWDTLNSKKIWQGNICNQRKDWTQFWLKTIVKPLLWSENEVTWYLVVYQDITKEKQNEDINRENTSIPGRQKLMETLASEWEKTLIVIHVNNLSQINTLYGPDAWDEAFKQSIQWLQHFIEPMEWKLYKLSGAELAIVFNKVVPQHLIHALESEFYWFKFEYLNTYIPLSFSGWAVIDGFSWYEMYLRGYLALQDSQRKGCFIVYDPQNLSINWYSENLKTIRLIEQAFEKHLITTFWQIIYHSRSERIKVEILMRMYTDESRTKFLLPDTVLPLIDMIGNYRKLMTERIVEDSFSQMQHIDCEFNINVGSKEVTNPQFIGYISEMIEKYHISPKNIVFEILEEVKSVDEENIRSFIYWLKWLGCKVAIDDFWTEYAGSKRAMNSHFDYIKIDMSRVRDVHMDENKQLFIQTTVDYAHKMGMEAVAEWIEKKAERDMLIELDVDWFQWFLFARPEPLEKLIHDWKLQ